MLLTHIKKVVTKPLQNLIHSPPHILLLELTSVWCSVSLHMLQRLTLCHMHLKPTITTMSPVAYCYMMLRVLYIGYTLYLCVCVCAI